jgi:DNA-binding transcriptional MerR regulator
LDKAPDAFRTISEVAEEINVPQHVLRFWESRFAQIRPMKRGGGRRYYRPDDVDLLRGVRHLLYGEGYTIRGVQRILREHGVAFVQNVWRPGVEAPPQQEEDAEETDGVDQRGSGGGREPSFFGFLASRVGDASEPGEPAVPLPPSKEPSQPAGLGEQGRRRLQAALDELLACRRMIANALAEPVAADDELEEGNEEDATPASDGQAAAHS